MAEHAAFVHVPRSHSKLADERLCRLESDVRACVERAGVGELHGVELTDDEWIAFAYGPSADGLVRALDTVLGRWDLPSGSYLVWRRGGLDAPEERRALAAGEGSVTAGRSDDRRRRPRVSRRFAPADLLAALAIEPPGPRRSASDG